MDRSSARILERPRAPARLARLIPPSLGLALSLGLLLLGLFQVLRVGMLLRNRDLAEGLGATAIARAFLVGSRFDLAAAAYAIGPLLLLATAVRLLAGLRWVRRVYVVGSTVVGSFLVVGGLAELEFYREFYSRYNMLALQYWSHPGTVASMIWHGYAVWRYLMIGAVLLGIHLFLTFRLARFWIPVAPVVAGDGAQRKPSADGTGSIGIGRPVAAGAGPILQDRQDRASRAEAVERSGRAAGESRRGRLEPRWLEPVLFVPVLGIVMVAARGGVRGRPLQWGDAVHSSSAFANALAQNGFWTLGHGLAGFLRAHDAGDPWQHALPPHDARERARRIVFLPDDEPVGDPALHPLRRRRLLARPATGPHEASTPGSATRVSLRGEAATPPNVVVIIMESFSARYVGALGSPEDRTPEFDRLAREGILFDHCFSNGSHTDQACYCVTASFPSLPGHETLMQSILGDQPFDSLPLRLGQRGYDTMFLYNGDLSWDNMHGFFKSHGVDRFIGRYDFDRSDYFDATWGVSDKALFERANREFARATTPFCATVLTLSNHTPFDLPRPLPFEEITDAGEHNDRMNGIRFADWSLGHFFDLARREDYFHRTLFVLVGDHGFSVPPVMTEINLLRFHVPLLFYAPALLAGEDRRCATVASQVDIAPTILGLLGDHEPHQHWGRDLFALPEDDPGFALLKPAGGGSEVGFVRGDTVVVRDMSGPAQLYRFDLGFPPRLETLGDREKVRLREMDLDLRAYVQTGLQVLTSRHASGETGPASSHDVAPSLAASTSGADPDLLHLARRSARRP